MRLFPGKIAAIASEIVKLLAADGDIETEAPREVELDIASVLNAYLKAEQEVSDAARDYVREHSLSSSEMNRYKQAAAEKRGIKTGEETLDYLLDQVVEMLLHSNNVEEVFSADNEMRRKMAPIFKKYMAVDAELEREVRGQLKHVQEGTSTWEVEYQRVMGDIKRRKGLSLESARASPHEEHDRIRRGGGVARPRQGARRGACGEPSVPRSPRAVAEGADGLRDVRRAARARSDAPRSLRDLRADRRERAPCPRGGSWSCAGRLRGFLCDPR
jgi:hypothetical protein